MSTKEQKTNTFSFSSLKNDIPAGIVVFLVALPLCLGIALASGAPLFSGVIAGIVGGLVVASFSGSALSVSGPAAGLTVIVLNSVQQLGTYESFLLAVVLAGIIQIVLGFLKAGIIGHYFPSSVIKGMLAAIGLILIFKQIPLALGYDKDNKGTLFSFQAEEGNVFSEMLGSINHVSIGAIIITVVSLFILSIWEKNLFKRFTLFRVLPGALIVVVSGVLMNQLFIMYKPEWSVGQKQLVSLPVADSMQGFMNQFTFPDFTALFNPQVYIVAFTIAIIASLESLLSVEAADKLDPEKRNTPNNRELKAQGIGNLISGLIGGLPITAVIVRSSANINAGGKTKFSAIFHGMLLLMSVIFLANILNQIPLACLAAILLMVGYKLAKIELFKAMYKLGWDQFLPFIVTIIVILLTDLLKGIGVGMIVSVFFVLRNNYKHPYFFIKSNHKEGEIITIELSEDVSFLNKASVKQTLYHLPENSSVVIDGRKAKYIDLDVLEIIHTFNNTKHLKNITMQLICIPPYNGTGAH